ncbi:MAG: Rubrerythrin, partial [Deltaproteobacteria bacterium]|nr:Rubrerythrin [Deltaproteobacteria bacterium]
VITDEVKMPFPEFSVSDDMQLSEIIKKAMEAEKWAADFYKDMEKKMDGDDEKAMARYLAAMEESHYYLLKSELEIAYNFEFYDEVHEMMHAGP